MVLTLEMKIEMKARKCNTGRYETNRFLKMFSDTEKKSFSGLNT